MKKHLVVLILLIFSFTLRLSLISKGPYHLDCLNLALQAQKTLDTLTLQNLFGSGYPLTVILGAIFIFLSRIFSINDPVIAVNFMSVALSSLSVMFFYWVVKELLDRRTALFSSGMLSISPIFLGISVYGKSHAPAMFFLFVTIFFLLKHKKTNRQRDLLLSSIMLGCMGAARLQDMILVSVAIGFLFLTKLDQKFSRSNKRPEKKIAIIDFFIFWITTAIVTSSFHLPYILGNNKNSFTNQFDLFLRMGLTGNFRGFISPSLFNSLEFLITSCTEVGLAIAAVGFVWLAKDKPKTFLFCFLWLLIPLLFYGNLFTTAPRFLTILLPAVFIAQGYLFNFLSEINISLKVGVLALYVIIIGSLLKFIYPILKIRHDAAILPDYAHWVQKNTEKDSRIITADEHKFIQYYGHRKTLGRPLGKDTLSDAELLNFTQELDRLLEENVPVYITNVSLFSYDTKQRFSNLIQQNYKLDLIGDALYETWHTGSLKQLIYSNPLYRINKTTPTP